MQGGDQTYNKKYFFHNFFLNADFTVNISCYSPLSIITQQSIPGKELIIEESGQSIQALLAHLTKVMSEKNNNSAAGIVRSFIFK